ncbi:MAG: HlyD family secretion protein [Gammaproteobacteria bacterium]|nr:HlyD family secretion protein [Gammaproteobacteria bacterium]
MRAPKPIPLPIEKKPDETVAPLGIKKPGGFTKRNSIILMLGVIFFSYAGAWVYQHHTHIYSSDARIAADMITLSSEVSGRVTDVSVGAGESVVAGDMILNIDNAEALAQRAQIEARLKSVDAKKTTLDAKQGMLEAHIVASRLRQKSALVAAEAAVNVGRSSHLLAQQDLKRGKQKIQEKVISQQAFERIQAKAVSAREALHQHVAAVEIAHAALAEVEAENQKLRVFSSKKVELAAQATGIEAELRQHDIDLSHRMLRTVQAGIVDDVFISKGEHVNTGQRLALMHNPEQVWVSTNIKETNVRHLKIGAPVEITLDAYPGLVLAGSVARIGQTATSVFSLIPNPNPSGNFTKVTQRIPVRINFNKTALGNQTLRPGMMVEVKIER